MTRMAFACAAALVLGGCHAGSPPSPPPGLSPQPAPIDWTADDSVHIAFLTAHGRRIEREGIVVWAPADSLDAQWVSHFSDSLARAVAGLKSLIGGPYAWQRHAGQTVTYYLGPGRFIAHASYSGAVFISLYHVRQGTGPFLHEAAHVFLSPPAPFFPYEYRDSLEIERVAAGFPFWLSEGLADYLAQSAAESTGFREGDVFKVGGLARSDSVCAARLKSSPRREEIEARIGRPGRLDALFTTDRAQVAPTYYACSQAFTRYLVGRMGVRPVVTLFATVGSETWLTDWTTASGQPLEALRRAWLDSIGFEP